jgi:hypothetical protein
VACLGERRLERGELIGATDEDRTDDVRCHVSSMPAGQTSGTPCVL